MNSLNDVSTCTCGAAQILLKREQDHRLIQFLMGLNQVYETVRGNILMMKPLPSINEAYSLLMHDEKQREIHAYSQFLHESASMNANARFQMSQSSQSDSKKNVMCSHCKKPGHHVSKCYRLVGFPKDFKFTKPRKFTANVQTEHF